MFWPKSELGFINSRNSVPVLSDISASDVHSLHKRVKDAFQAFDYEMNNTVDVRWVLYLRILLSLVCEEWNTGNDKWAGMEKVLKM